MVRTRTRCRLAVAALALAVLAACGGSGGRTSVPTVTFAGGASTTAGADAGAASTTGGTTTAASGPTTSAAPPTSTVAPTTAAPAPAGTTTLTTGTLASLPPGYTDISIPDATPELLADVLAGYQAFQTARRAVGQTPAAPPWDQLAATVTSAALPTFRASYERVFAEGHSYRALDTPVSRARVVSMVGDAVAVVEDCVTAWSYAVDTATGEPLPGQDADVAGPTNTPWRVTLRQEGGTWRMDGYDTAKPEPCAGF